MGGHGGFSVAKSPYDVKSGGGLKNFCGKCATGPMKKVTFGLWLGAGLSVAVGALCAQEQSYRPRWCVWNTPCGDYAGTIKQAGGHH